LRKNIFHIPISRLFKYSVKIISACAAKRIQRTNFYSTLIIFLPLNSGSYQLVLYIKKNQKLEDMLCGEKSHTAFQRDQS